MDNDYFYNNYGQILAEKQSKNTRLGHWSYNTRLVRFVIRRI